MHSSRLLPPWACAGGLLLALSSSLTDCTAAALPAPAPPTAAPLDKGAAARQAPDSLANFAIFGAQGVTLDNTTKVNAGLVGSNGDVSVGPFSHFAGLEGGRLGYSSTGGGVTVIGNITFNGDVMLGQDASVLGAINSGGGITINDRPHITGDVTAAGNVIVALSGGIMGNVQTGANFAVGGFCTITGNVLANGSAQISGTVNGDITCNDLSIDTFGRVNGKTKRGTGTVTPAKYIPENVPGADPFKAGKEDSTGLSTPDSPLPPGRYAALNVPASRPIYLTAGDYYVESLTFGDSASVNLVKLSSTKGLHVFVAGDCHVGRSVKMYVKDQPLASADASLAKKVLWEVQGKLDAVGSDEIFGTIFAPNDSITLGAFTTLIGSLISGAQITTGTFFTQTFMPSGKFAVPTVPTSPILTPLVVSPVPLPGHASGPAR